MRIIRILLVLVFLAVAAVYTLQGMADRISSADEPPVLSCDDAILAVSVRDDDSALLAGITATDGQDGDLTDQVLITGISRLIEDSNAKVSYVVFDSDDNMATLTRTIRYTDYELPRFSLDEPLVYGVGEEIVLLDRLHAEDVVDGDITNSIRVTYTANTSDSGVHDLNVQVTNSMGDTAWLTLPVMLLTHPDNMVDVTLDTYLLYLEQGDSFRPRDYLAGASYNEDPVSLSNVSISGEVDTNTPGTYRVHYTCTYGTRTGTVILTVVVE